jgi:Domain of unknown function (DUF4157)
MSTPRLSLRGSKPAEAPQVAAPVATGWRNLSVRTAPPIVTQELTAPGRPLDSVTRVAAENHFQHSFAAVPLHQYSPAPASARTGDLPITAPGNSRETEADRLADAVPRGRPAQKRTAFDLSGIRVHTGERAAESARAIQAVAYTSGRDIVFGAGQFSPHTRAGRRLLMHELAHTVQAGNDRLIQRRPDPSPTLTKAELARKAQLDRLARDPLEAHRAWKHLEQPERAEVLSAMSARYGAKFADEFLAVAETGKFDDTLIYYQPKIGPNREQLGARGYRYAGEEHTGNAGVVVERWVHPSGKWVRRDGSPPPSAQPEEKRPETTPTPTKRPPEKIQDGGSEEDEFKPLAETTPLRKKILRLMEGLPLFNDMIWNDLQLLKANPAAAERAEIEERIKENRAQYDTDYADLLDLIDDVDGVDQEAYKYAKKNSDAINNHHEAVIEDYNELKHPTGGGTGSP